MCFNSLKLQEIAQAQDTSFRVFGFLQAFGIVHALPHWLSFVKLPTWGLLVQPLGFILFLTCIMAENKRPPFDIPEGESEIVAGYHMEYSGMRFGLFYTAEFLEIPVIAMIVVTLFLGGWTIPWLSTHRLISSLTGILGVGAGAGLCLILHVVSFFVKVIVMIWLQMQIRWTLPRFRYDQVMDLCWKIMLPLSLANVFVTGLVILAIQRLSR
jgi:NADH-quinone oxidoreductase subunit H